MQSDSLAGWLLSGGIRVGYVLVLYCWRPPWALAKGSPSYFQCDLNIFLKQILIPLLHLKILVLSDIEDEVMRAAGKLFLCFDWTPCFSRKQALHSHVSRARLPVSLTNFQVFWPLSRHWGDGPQMYEIPCVEMTSKLPSQCADTMGMIWMPEFNRREEGCVCLLWALECNQNEVKNLSRNPTFTNDLSTWPESCRTWFQLWCKHLISSWNCCALGTQSSITHFYAFAYLGLKPVSKECLVFWVSKSLFENGMWARFNRLRNLNRNYDTEGFCPAPAIP